MNPDERALLERVAKMTEENNVMLRKIRRTMKAGTVMKAVYWSVLILASIGATYFIQPYIDQLRSIYSGVDSNLDTVREAEDVINNFHFPGWGNKDVNEGDLQAQ